MAGKSVLVKARLSAGHHPDEIFAVVGPKQSSFVDLSQVRPKRQPPGGQTTNGQVLAFVIEAGSFESLVELPGVAVGALRGWVVNTSIGELD